MAFDLAKKKAKSPLASEKMSPNLHGGRFEEALFGDGELFFGGTNDPLETWGFSSLKGYQKLELSHLVIT